MTPVRCPRCHREAPELSAFCAGCGAPLLLGDEERRGPLDATLDLDRRGPGLRGDGPARVAPPPVPIPGPAETPPPSRRAPGPPPGIPVAPGRTSAPPPAPPARAAVPPPAPPARSAVAAPGPSGATDLDGVPEPEVDALEVHLTRAATWRRALAWVLDGAPFVAAGGALGWRLVGEAAAGLRAPAGVDELIELVARERVIALSVAAAVVLALGTYATLAHTLAGATLGKRLVGIRVVGPDGTPPSFARSAIRSALCVVSIALFGMGFLLALFTRTGRGLHDLLARTWVVKAP